MAPFRPLAVSLFAATAFLQCRAADASVEVTLPSGAKIVGTTEDNNHADAFLGIQYAKVGERFTRSELVIPNETIDATQYGPDCHQVYTGLPSFLYQPREQAEECLYLNIWRPTSNNNEGNLAVMVWLHSGAFALGSGADAVYNGAKLAREQNIVVVTLNYRLGPLGFLPQDERGFGGMNGLYDQIMALQWVHQFIESFGGDPNRVTLFGESAGGEAACMLSVSPLAKGLFRRVILQSGECINNPWAGGIPNDDIVYGLDKVEELLNVTGASSVQDLQDASVFPPEVVNTMSPLAGFPIMILDRDILPAHPRELYQDATNIVPVEIVVGANSFEDAMVMGMPPDVYVDVAETSFEETAFGFLDEDVSRALTWYNASDYYQGDAAAAYAQFVGDYYISCPARSFAKTVVDAGLSVYVYEFAHHAVTDPIVHVGLDEYLVDTSGWASHLAEMPFVFGNLEAYLPFNTSSDALEDADYAMSLEMRTRWAAFANKGSPNAEGIETWTQSTSKGLNIMIFQDGQGSLVSNTEKENQCSVFSFYETEEDDLLGDDVPKSSTPSLALPATTMRAIGVMVVAVLLAHVM